MSRAPVAVSQRTAAAALGLSRKLVSAQIRDKRLRLVPGSSLVLVADLELAFGPTVPGRISEHLAGRAGRRQTAQA